MECNDRNQEGEYKFALVYTVDQDGTPYEPEKLTARVDFEVELIDTTIDVGTPPYLA